MLLCNKCSFDKLWLGVGCYQTWNIWASKGGLIFFKEDFFLKTTNGWIVAKCLLAKQQDNWNFWWARSRHSYKILDPLLLGTLLTIKPTFYYSYQPCDLSTLVCKTIYPHFIVVYYTMFFSFLTTNLINLNYSSQSMCDRLLQVKPKLQEDPHELWDLLA